MIGRLLLEWRTKQALEYKNKNRQYTNEEMFHDDQMIYLLAPHSSALQTILLNSSKISLVHYS